MKEQNPNNTPEGLRQPYLPDHQALTLASRLKSTPVSEYIHELACHPNEWVRLEIARNPHTPEPILRGLWLDDPVNLVKQAARTTLQQQGRLAGPISQRLGALREAA